MSEMMIAQDAIHVKIGAGEIIAPGWPSVASLAGKLAKVMSLVSPVHRNERHEKQGYRYASYGEVAEEIRKAMAKANLSLSIHVMKAQREEENNGIYNRVTLHFVLLDGDTGAMMVCPWEGEAADFGTADKGINKAITSASKYFLMRTFLVSTTDEESNDGLGATDTAAQAVPRAMQSGASARERGNPERTSWGAPSVLIKTSKWGPFLKRLANSEAGDYYKEDGKLNIWHVLGVVAKRFNEVNDENFAEVEKFIYDYPEQRMDTLIER